MSSSSAGRPERCELLHASDGEYRLLAAMREAIAAHGYAGATVARVVEYAEVSRATFYQYFSSREECFLATYRASAKAARTLLSSAASNTVPTARPDVVLETLVQDLVADDALARLMLVEALAAPEAIRAEHEALIASVDESVAGFLDEQPAAASIQIPSTALIAGVADVLTRRVLAERPKDLPNLQSDLGRWVDAYRLPDGVLPLAQARWHQLGRFAKFVPSHEVVEPALLPRGRSALPQADVASARRQRIVDATARLCSERGFSELTVAAIAEAARVPRAAFYAHFDSKQEALMAAQTHGVQGAMAAAAAAYSPTAPWPTRVWKATRAFLAFVAESPHYARLDLVESYAAGAQAVRHRQQNQMVFALFLEDGYRQNPDAARLPRACSEAIAGAILGLLRRVVVEGKTERMLSIAPAAAYTILAPFIGAEEALAQVQAWAQVDR